MLGGRDFIEDMKKRRALRYRLFHSIGGRLGIHLIKEIEKREGWNG